MKIINFTLYEAEIDTLKQFPGSLQETIAKACEAFVETGGPSRRSPGVAYLGRLMLGNRRERQTFSVILPDRIANELLGAKGPVELAVAEFLRTNKPLNPPWRTRTLLFENFGPTSYPQNNVFYRSLKDRMARQRGEAVKGTDDALPPLPDFLTAHIPRKETV